jgi:hypothetical protein
VVVGLVLTFALPRGGEPGDRAVTASSRAGALPPVGHVFVINIENKDFSQAWCAGSKAPYLARTLRSQGVLLRQFYGTAHHSLPNYLAQISGQGPDRATQSDCATYTAFRGGGATRAPQQVVGNGCVYPAGVRTLPRQLTTAGLSWKGYMQDMARPCQHPRPGYADPWRAATATSQYATRHNPFVYFRSIVDHPAYCRAHVVALSHLSADLGSVATTPALSYITPDLCHDGHDVTCKDGGPGGLAAVDQWMRTWIPLIRQSPAYRADGMIVITADESDDSATSCCGETAGPNAAHPGITGPGGGRVGALVISPFAGQGTTSDRAYNQYSLLATLEDLYGVPRLGFARTVPRVFGSDVFTSS